jgi:signal transduction histidine kinase
MPKLFQKFSMVGNNYLVKQNTQGTGLGLYLSKSIIELMNGKIWVESEGLGRGSRFSFTLKTA